MRELTMSRQEATKAKRTAASSIAVPRIRFKGCEGEWERHALSEYFTLRNESNESGEVKEILSVLKDVGVILYSEKGNIGNRAKDDVTHYKIAHKGDIVLNSMNVIIGSVGVSHYDGCISPAYYALAPKTNCYPEYFGYWFWRKETQKVLAAQACGMMEIRRKISERDLLAISRPMPPLLEQKLIGKCLLSIDHLLRNSLAHLSSLRQLKRSMLVKMFPRPGQCVPEIRFKGFEGEWKSIPLSEIAVKVTEKNVACEHAEVFTNSAEQGVVSQRDYFDFAVAKNLGGYYVVRPRDFVYNPRISNEAPVGPININALNRVGVMSPLYFVFRTHDVDTSYLQVFFKTRCWHPFMYFNGDSGARSDRFSIKNDVFMRMPISKPKDVVEQQKIGAFFKNLDSLIAVAEKRVAKLRQVKASLLERMFV